MNVLRCRDSLPTIHRVARWAGFLGLYQSITWICLCIVSIVAYCCIIDIDEIASFGSLTKFVFFELYFRGNCEPDIFAKLDYTILKSVSTVLDSHQILVWVCVYLGLSVVWLLTSCLVLLVVKKHNLNGSYGILYMWAATTLAVCCMDLAFGIIFSIDYSRFQAQAYNYNFETYQAGVVDAKAAELISAQIAAISMMIISFRGFILWIMNCGLMIAIFAAAYILHKYMTNEHDFFRTTFGSNSTVLATREHPIDAYETKNEIAFDNVAFVVEQRSSPIELNEEPLNRAARISSDNLQERRFRNLESFQQYPPPRTQEQHSPSNEISMPAPDYTPPMPRANQNGHVKNTRH